MSTTDTGRSQWAVQLRGARLEADARRLAAYHGGRYGVWQDELEGVEAQIQESGITVERHQQTGGDRFQALIDPSLAQRLAECQAKRDGHAREQDALLQWAAFFAESGDQVWWVREADFSFFDCGHLNTPDEAEVSDAG